MPFDRWEKTYVGASLARLRIPGDWLGFFESIVSKSDGEGDLGGAAEAEAGVDTGALISNVLRAGRDEELPLCCVPDGAEFGAVFAAAVSSRSLLRLRFLRRDDESSAAEAISWQGVKRA